jgi:hypothetical protein
VPTLALGRDPEQNFINLLATMLFPDDPDPMAALPKVVDPQHPIFAGLAKDRFLEGWEQGKAAGLTLLAVRIIAEHHPAAETSIERAALLVESGTRTLRRAKNRKNFPRHERKIREAFYNYRCVAHLWAAWMLLETSRVFEVAGSIDLGLLLAVAEDMRRFGESFMMPRRREPILTPSEIWKVPNDMNLPEIRIHLPPLAQSALEALERYRARPR